MQSLTAVRHLALVEAVVGLEIVLVAVLLVLGRLAAEPRVEVVVLVVVLLPGTPQDRGRRQAVAADNPLVIVPAEDAAVVLEGELLARQELLLAGVAAEALGVKDLVLGAHHELVLVEGPQAFVALGPEQSASKEKEEGNKERKRKMAVVALFLRVPLSVMFVCIADGSPSLPTPFIVIIMHSFLAMRILKWVLAAFANAMEV